MATFEEKAKKLAATAGQIASMQGADREAKVLGEPSATLVRTGSQDYLDGTVILYTLMLEVPIPMYAAIDEQRKELEQRIRDRVTQLIRADRDNAITEVVISPILAEESHPAEPSPGEAGTQEEVPSFWQPGFFRLFISHTSANKETAHRLKESIAGYQIAAFVAHDDIEPTKE